MSSSSPDSVESNYHTSIIHKFALVVTAAVDAHVEHNAEKVPDWVLAKTYVPNITETRINPNENKPNSRKGTIVLDQQNGTDRYTFNFEMCLANAPAETNSRHHFFVQRWWLSFRQQIDAVLTSLTWDLDRDS